MQHPTKNNVLTFVRRPKENDRISTGNSDTATSK